MTKDLKNKEGQKLFLNDYLDDLLLNINESYGPILLDELQKRLEFTINEFNNEMNEAFGLLIKRNDDRRVLHTESLHNTNGEDDDAKETEWEKKLKEIDNKSN